MEESGGQPVDQQQQQQQQAQQLQQQQQQQQQQQHEVQSHLDATPQASLQQQQATQNSSQPPMQQQPSEQQPQQQQQQFSMDAEDSPQAPNVQHSTPNLPSQQPPQSAQPPETLIIKREPDSDHPQSASNEVSMGSQEDASNHAHANEQQASHCSPSLSKSNILEAIEDFDSSLPGAVVHNFLNSSGKTTNDPRIIKLIAAASAAASAPTRNLTEDLFSSKKWGVTPIRQDTPWELPPSPTQTGGPQAVPVTAAAPTLPPGISQSSGDSFRSSTASHLGDFHPVAAAAAAVAGSATLSNQTNSNQFGLNGLASNLSQMNLANSGAAGMHPSSRIDQSWRPPLGAIKQHPQALAAAAASSSSPFANHNLMNSAQSIQKSLLNSSAPAQNPSASAFLAIHQQNNEFARAPGPASSSNTNSSSSSSLDNSIKYRPYGMANTASSTWSAFGTPTGSSEPDSEWPRSTSGRTGPNSTQSSNAFDLVPEFEPGKSWPRSVFMKSLGGDGDNSSMASASNLPGMPSLYGGGNGGSGGGGGAGGGSGVVGGASKSPTGNQYEQSGIGTWSPVVVKGGRPNSKWDGDGPDSGRGENGRFDDGTAIWGSTSGPSSKVSGGVEWGEKNGDPNSINDNSRSMAANNQQQSYRPQQSSSSTSLLVSSNTSPSSQHDQLQRNQQTLKQPSLNFDQVQQQLNALSSQANQPNRGHGLSCNVPSTQQLKHMVQQIQLAVQAGHLNPQILDQSLAPVTLQLLCQLLQNIRTLQQLQMQASQQFNKAGNHPAAVNVHITRTKQNILNLQNQIAAQQSIYLKQNQGHNISLRQPTGLATGGMGPGIGPTLPPGISQSGDSFRSGTAANDFHCGPAMVNNFGGVNNNMGANGLANNLGQMNLGGAAASVLHSSRVDWRVPAPIKQQHQQQQGPPMGSSSASSSSSPFANHTLMNSAQSIQKSMLNSSGGGGNGGGSAFLAMHQPGGNEFARAPGQASNTTDNNIATKPYGMTNRSSTTWSAFGSSAHNEPEPEWPKTTTSGISSGGNSTQLSNAFDLVPEFEPGKPWRGSMLMKSVEDDPTMTPGSMTRSLAPQRKTIWSDEML